MGKLKARVLQYDISKPSSTDAGGVLSVPNPEGVDLIITECIINVTTAAAADCKLSVGTHATANGDDNALFSGQNTTAVGALKSSAAAVWPAGGFLVAKTAAASTSMVGAVYVKYIYA